MASQASSSTTPVHDRIVAEVGSWSEVHTGAGRFGSTRFTVGRRELGHLHGETVLDLPLAPSRKRELLAREVVEQHRYTPAKSGWVSLRIGSDQDVGTAIDLLREQHERALSRRDHEA